MRDEFNNAKRLLRRALKAKTPAAKDRAINAALSDLYEVTRQVADDLAHAKAHPDHVDDHTIWWE